MEMCTADVRLRSCKGMLKQVLFLLLNTRCTQEDRARLLKKGETDSPTRSANMHSRPAEDIGVCKFEGATAQSRFTTKSVVFVMSR